MPCILAIDQSTSATKALLFDSQGEVLDRESAAHQQFYPQPGWVEHDAEEIWQNLLTVTQSLITRNAHRADQLLGLSITNQRETIVVFDKDTGKPLYPAIVWQCRRSDRICKQHIEHGHSDIISTATGLRIDPYFSGSKLQWMVEHYDGLKQKLVEGEALIGTVDTYLIYRLTQGKVFATDPSNASRTLLYDINRLSWSQSLCDLWQVPMNALAEVRESSASFGETQIAGVLSKPCPIIGVIGDSQASLFALRCFESGSAKVTFGTGSSVLLNIGNQPQFSKLGVVTALAWIINGQPTYAYEGIIIHSAATLVWLKDQLGLIQEVSELEELASQVEDEGGVYFIPAFSGLGLPYWDPDARAAIVGLSGYSNKKHVARAALNSIAYQLKDALEAMQQESGVKLTLLNADGGPSANQLLMQFTADITCTDLAVSAAPDCSALGAAMMGPMGLGKYQSIDEIAALPRNDKQYHPHMPSEMVNTLHSGWRDAMHLVLSGSKQNKNEGHS